MPLVWQDPEVAFVHRGVPIYRTYKDDDINHPMIYWYSFFPEYDAPTFDVRMLPYHNVKGSYEEIIRVAIEKGDLPIPETCKPECPHENLRVDSYQVTDACAPVTLDRDAQTGQVIDFGVSRIEGEMSEIIFYCEDCREIFKWDEVKNL